MIYYRTSKLLQLDILLECGRKGAKILVEYLALKREEQVPLCGSIYL